MHIHIVRLFLDGDVRAHADATGSAVVLHVESVERRTECGILFICILFLPLTAATSFEHGGPQCPLILTRSTSPL